MSCKNLAEELFKISPDIMLIPAHIWTPWFSVFGSNSGFNSLEEAFGKYTERITALETGLSCYDEETEVLTEEGWKRISEVKLSDKICTLNFKTEEIEYQKTQGIYVYDYRGKMYRLRTKRVDLLVTPNHKLLYRPADFRNRKPFRLKKAEFLFNKSKIFKKDGKWIGKEEKYFILPAVKIRHGSRFYSGYRRKKEKKIPLKDWLKFFGFWLAEGWVTQDNKRGSYAVCLANNNQDLLEEMQKLLKGFGYQVYRRKNVIRVRDYQLFCYLKQFGKCSDKFIPKEIKSLSKKYLEILLRYYLKGDGHIHGRTQKGLSATTSSIHLRDDLQEIALKIGISAYYKMHSKKGSPFRSPCTGKIYSQRGDVWVVYFIRQNNHTIMPSTIKKFNPILPKG